MDVYFFKDVGLNKNGWLNGCVLCHKVTSNLKDGDKINFNNIIYNIKVFLCGKCNRKLINNEEKYNEIYKKKLDSFNKYLNEKK